MTEFLPKVLPPKEWREFLDAFLSGKTISCDPGILEEMDEFQKYCVNEIKKSYQRTK